MGRKAFDLTGQRFGFLTVLHRVILPDGGPHAFWMCHCDCGAQHVVRATHLTTGAVTQCRGCSRSRTAAAGRRLPETVVELWCTGIGQEGGFARAIDVSSGLIMARSHFSTLAQQLASPPHMLKLVRSCLRMLETLGKVRPRNTGESWRHWFRACNVRVQLHTFTPAAKVQALWFDTSFAPGPDSIIERS